MDEPMLEDRRAPRAVRLSGAAIVVLVAGALALTVGAGVVRSSLAAAEADAVAVPTVAVTPAPAPSPYVYVTGAVLTPRLVALQPGDRVAAAIAAAGGFADEADQAAVNLARVVVDGEHLHVPVLGEAPPPQAGTAPGSGLVSINNGTATELESLPRIGPAIAQRIIAWRAEHGPFQSVDDLLTVPGIGERMLAELRDLVTL